MKNRYRSLCLLLLLAISYPSFSQNGEIKNDTLLTEKLWIVNLLLSPGIAHERAITPKSAIKGHVGLYGSFAYNSLFGSSYIVGPVVEIQLKNYFNIWRRSLSGKRTAFNSAEYIAFSFTNYFPSIIRKNEERFNNAGDNVLYLGPVIGHQRIRKHVGYYIEAGYLVPLVGQQLFETGIHFSFGLMLNITKKN